MLHPQPQGVSFMVKILISKGFCSLLSRIMECPEVLVDILELINLIILVMYLSNSRTFMSHANTQGVWGNFYFFKYFYNNKQTFHFHTLKYHENFQLLSYFVQA